MFIECIIIITIINCCSTGVGCVEKGGQKSLLWLLYEPRVVHVYCIYNILLLLCKWRIDGVKPVAVVVVVVASSSPWPSYSCGVVVNDVRTHAHKSNRLCWSRAHNDQRGVFGQMHAHTRSCTTHTHARVKSYTHARARYSSSTSLSSRVRNNCL